MAERLMSAQRKPTERVEEYEASKPDGTKVRVWHNIDTGETRIIE